VAQQPGAEGAKSGSTASVTEYAAPMRYSVFVETRLHEGIADPEGATIERSLPALGFRGVSGVKVGKSFRFVLEATDADAARAEAEDICARFLTNPVLESAAIAVERRDQP
jgi:phosphoribosylformylglycinamidine synthase subunit PurS